MQSDQIQLGILKFQEFWTPIDYAFISNYLEHVFLIRKFDEMGEDMSKFYASICASLVHEKL